MRIYTEINLPYMLFYETIKTKFGYNYYIINPKYCFSSFDNSIDNLNENVNNNDLFCTYGRTLINDIIKNKQSKVSKNEKIKVEETINSCYKFVTCRYADNSFKIKLLNKTKSKELSKKIEKSISFLCEDFVSSCCTINSKEFLIGLNNGKLIQLILIKEVENEKLKNDKLYSIKIEKYIQAHKKRINVIEINKRLGLIITAGDDNYIMIRKLYDFELLTPIKIKQKYIINMAKISPLNFLYIICFNKIKKQSVIFGYTLTGIKFAKSKYGFYDNIDFTRNGNIVTLINHSDLCILSGSELNDVQMNENPEIFHDFEKKKNKVKGSKWLKYDYFIQKSDYSSSYNKIITYISGKESKLNTLDIKNNNYFD